ncbi:MAG TPA: hypothetical protein VEX86_26150 [Longimicrobium sp.]|nr:hypothetical protein [Longimicrobium sp.]
MSKLRLEIEKLRIDRSRPTRPDCFAPMSLRISSRAWATALPEGTAV